MVLVRRIGQQRPYPLVLLLYVATLGVYGIYWHYKAHQELYRQFELDLEARDNGTVWLLLDRIFFPLRWIYQYGFVGNVAYVRKRMGITKGLTPARFLAAAVPGATLVWIALIALSWANIADDATFAVLLQVALYSFIIGAALQIPAFALLQGDLNRIWQAFDDRMVELLPPATWQPVPPAPGASSAAPPASAPWPPQAP